MTISLCMIVKNEEKVIGRCLDSVKDVFDEIIIVDTGSTDKTKKICAKYTNKIYDFAWVDDFSLARNVSFSYAKCDYIAWLDADDVLDEQNKLKFLYLKKNLVYLKPDVILCKYNTNYKNENHSSCVFFRERILKRDCGFIWQGFVHECIVPKGKIIYSDVEIFHLSAKNYYSDRNLKIYENHIKQGYILDVRHKLYYAKEFYYLKRFKKAKSLLENYLKQENIPTYLFFEAVNTLGKIYEALSETEKALNTYLKCFIKGVPPSEILCRIAFLYKNIDLESAILFFELALNKKQNALDFVIKDFCDFIPLIELSVCYYNVDYKKALYYHEKAKKIHPDDPLILFNEKFFKTK